MRILTLCIITIILSTILYPVESALKPDKSLVLWFTFDDGKGKIAKDSSEKGNDGKIKGKFKWEKSKEKNYKTALQFKNDVDVRAPFIPLNGKQDHTLDMWVSANLSSDQQLVFSQKDVNATNKSLHYRIYSSGTVRMGFYGNDLDTAAGAVKKGEWTHITFWHDAKKKNRRIYINGKKEAEDNGRGLFEGTQGDTVVGSWTETEQYFDGLIDEVRLWHRVLSEKEIVDSMKLMSLSVNPQSKLATKWSKLKSN